MTNVILSSMVKKRKNLLCAGLALVLSFAFLSCKQSPIMFMISNEVAPKDARIPGAPSNMVEFKQKLYLARRVVYSYGDGLGAGNADEWNKIKNQAPARGDVVDVAATSAALFVQSVFPFELWKTTDGETWETNPIPNSTGYDVQAIFAVDDQLFAAGAVRDPFGNEDYALLWYDESGSGSMVSLKEKMGANGRLSGAVHIGTDYYLSTLSGIYVISGAPAAGILSTASALAGSTGKGYITGLIADIPQTSLLAVTTQKGENARILTAPASGASTTFTEKSNYKNTRLNGGMNIAKSSSGTGDVLMLGFESESDNFNFGYREIVLNDDGSFPDTGYDLNVPGSSVLTSIAYSESSEDQYESSLGREIVSAIIKTPATIDAREPLFASTYRMGLWSYRNNEWNAEE